MAQETFTSTTTWVCPANVTSVDVECWGGGGGGGGGILDDSAAGGGGGGAYSKKVALAVTPATSYTVTVGAGGSAGTNGSAGTTGGDTWFSTSGTVLAKGGIRGQNSVWGALGGSAASGIGDTKYSGGNAASGTNNVGGGSSAGTAANGNNGSGSTGGSAPTGGGAGGSYSSGSNPGSAPGGGGSGAFSVGGLLTGGVGAAGKIVLTYFPAITETASNSLSMSHAASSIRERSESVSSSLAMSHSALGTVGFFVANTLGLTDSAACVVDRIVSVSNSLSITHGATGTPVRAGIAANTLTLTHQAINNSKTATAFNTLILNQIAVSSLTALNQSASNNLTLTHAAQCNYVNGSSDLALTQTVNEIGPVYVVANTTLEITDEVVSFGSIFSQAVIDTLTLTHLAVRPVDAAASNNLSLTHAAVASRGLSHTLGLTHSAVGIAGKAASNQLALTHTVSLAGSVQARTLTHTIGLTHSATHQGSANSISLCSYSPQINTGNLNYTAPPATGPTISAQTDIVLTYPFVSPTVTLTLRAPEIQDKETFDYARVLRETRGGTQKIYRKSTWPKSRTLSVSVAFNTKAQSKAFIDFVEVSIGQEIGLRDHLNRQWVGIIITPDEGYAHRSRRDRLLSFKFEGVLDD